jgi:transposase
MVVVDAQGVPLGGLVDSASPAEVRLAEATLNEISVPRPGRGRPRTRPKKLIADKAYDSHPLRATLKKRGISLVVPYKKNRANHRIQNGQVKAQYRRRWTIERTISWISRFKRLVVRYENKLYMYVAFFHLACAMITLRKCKEF